MPHFKRIASVTVAAAIALVSGVVLAGPPAEEADVGVEAGPVARTPEDNRRVIEEDIAQLGGIHEGALGDQDFTRAACTKSKKDSGSVVLGKATTEMLLIRDANAGAEAKATASAKLDALANNSGRLVSEALACQGANTDDKLNNPSDTDEDAPQTIPLLDPTSGLGESPAPPPVDGGWLAVGSPSA